MRGLLGASAIVGVACLGTAAHAQVSVPAPATYQAIDARGVNLANGAISVPMGQISIGPAETGLRNAVTYVTDLQYQHSIVGGISRDTLTGAPAYQFTVTTPDRGYVFTSVTGTSGFFLRDGQGGTLTRSGTIWTLTALDGGVFTFDSSIYISAGGVGGQGLLTTIARPDGQQITYHYSGTTGDVRLQSVTNNFGYQIHFSYDGLLEKVEAINNAVDRCTPTANICTLSRSWPTLTFGTNSVTDSLGGTTRLIFTGLGLTGVARPTKTTGQSLTFGGTDVLKTVNDGTGTWTYEFGPPSALEPPYTTTTTITDPLSHQSTVLVNWFPYNHVNPELLRNRVMTTTDALGNTTDYGYTVRGWPTSVTNPEGDSVVTVYNGRGDLISWTHNPKPTSPLSPQSITATYSDCSTPILCGRPTAVEDARGNVTDYTYNAQGQVLTATLPAPTTGAVRPQTRQTYADRSAWYHRNGSSSITQAATAVSVPLETSACVTAATCDGTVGEIVTTTTYQIGSSSAASNILPLQVSTGAGNGSLTATTTTVWDATGDPRTVDGPLPGTADTTRYVYDVMRQPVGVIGPDPDGAGARLFPAVKTEYNADGQVTYVRQGTTTGQTDANWAAFSALQSNLTAYDVQGRRVRDTLAVGTADAMVTQYAYDAAWNLTCSTQRMNPAIFASLPASACTLGTEGAFGKDRISRNTYDNANRLLSSTSGYLVDPIIESQTWTDNGKVATRTDGSLNLSTYVYDGFDRVSRLRFPNASGGGSSTTDYEDYGYDAADNVTSFRNRGGQIITATFDALNRQTLVNNPSGTADVSFTYDNLSRQLTAADGAQTVTQAWDALSRMRSQTTPLGAVAFQHDLAGRRTRITWPGSPTYYAEYAYDLSGQVTKIQEYEPSTGLSLLADYAYDDLGRRIAVTRVNGVVTAYGYDAADRLTSLSHDLAGTASDVSFTLDYNPAGQIVSRTSSNAIYDYVPATGTAAYVNNGRNQVTTAAGAAIAYDARWNITDNGPLAQTYDALNRLTAVTGTSTYSYDPLGRLYEETALAAYRFLYAGDQSLGQYGSVTGNLSRRYIPGPGGDERIAWHGSSTLKAGYWPITDERGSVIANTSTGGSVSVAPLTYDEYGRPGANNSQEFQYTGQRRLVGTELYYYKARVYDPALGRFLQTDPVGYDAGLNLYAYVGNDPVNITDPTGMVACPDDNPSCGDAPLPPPSEEDPPVLPPIIVVAHLRVYYVVPGAPVGPPIATIPLGIPAPQTLIDPVGTIGRYLANAISGQDGDGSREQTPETNPEVFRNVTGGPGKENVRTGEVWVRDMLHRNHYEVYRDRRAFEQGRRTRDVWSDGRPKRNF